jgi:hypothetical protein
MHRESVYVCTYAQGGERVVGRVRAWDHREAAQLFAFELQSEDALPVGPHDVTVRAARRLPGRRRTGPASKR